jgi:PAS domain S-box-containing protein/putative nucleotidyltransferase with HDIG domain
MSRSEILYLLPYIGSLAISVWVMLYAWRHRRAPGATAFSLYGFGQSLWILGFILKLLSPGLTEKLFWDSFQWSAAQIILIVLPIFVVQYTERRYKNPRLLILLSLVVPLAFMILLWTNDQHQLIYQDLTLNGPPPFAELKYPLTPVVYGYAFYCYSIAVWGLLLLILRFVRTHSLYRVQVAYITLGLLIPIMGTVFSLADIPLAPQRDNLPFTAAVGNLLIAWSMFRFRIFEIVPIGRDKVFEDMVDPVVVIDNHDIVLDVNRSMLKLLCKESADVIGQSSKVVFDEFPIPIKLYSQVSYARAETSFEFRGKTVHYEMTIWPLLNTRKQIAGRVYISHDITELKKLERELRELNQELEDRVRARTKDLAESYDTTLEGWAKALELRDKETEGHSRRVTETTLKLACALEIPEDELVHIRRGAILHDIGKMAIPDVILRKTGTLSPEEQAIVHQHPEIAYNMLKGIPYLQDALDIPYCHHERWDGSGYPRGLKRREIPLAARIFAVTDVWDALCSNRPYNIQWPKEEAIAYMVDQAGKQFDPRIVNVFLKLVEQGEISTYIEVKEC